MEGFLLHCLIPFLLTIILLIQLSTSTILVEEVREDVIERIDNAWTQLKDVNRIRTSKENLIEDLGRFLKGVPISIGRVEKELQHDEYELALQSLIKAQNVSKQWKSKWSEISVLTSPVDVLYGHFKLFPDMPQTFMPGEGGMDFDATTVADLILKPIYHSDDKDGSITFSYLLDHAHTTVVSSYNYHETDAFTQLRSELDKFRSTDAWCLWNGKTAQRIIYGFYVSLATVDIKAYTILNFAYMLQYALNGTTTGNDISFAKQVLRNQAYEKLVAAKSAINKAQRVLWRCDPRRHQEGETYEQFTELLQAVIENESEMHPKGSCKQSCKDFTFTESKCTGTHCLSRRKCTGDLVDCRYVAADAKVCTANAPRRFEFIDYKRGPLLGKSMKCPRNTERRDSHWRFWYHCSNCLCLCDDPNSPTTIRHLSLASVVSDVPSNKIVTGIRFVMKNGILQLQIEEGTAVENGYIGNDTLNWKPVSSLRKHSLSVARLDYFHRGLALDDILLKPNYVVTGVRIHRIGEHFGLMVQATQINPITGKLLPKTSHWISNDNTPDNIRSPRRELILDDVDVPTFSPKRSAPDSVHDEFLMFGATSRTKDVAQTTIPFIDIQPVRPNPPVWLKGVGIYHKGHSGYGGYIAPKIFTFNMIDFMEENIGRK